VSRLMLLVIGILVGMALVLVPIERGWVSPEGLRALLRRDAPAAQIDETRTRGPSAAVAPPVVTDTAPFGGAAPQPLPPPPLPASPASAATPSTIAPPTTPSGDLSQSAPPSTRESAAVPLPLPPGSAGLLVPVKGVLPTQLSDTFTQSRGSDRRHDAIDILAPRGTPVLAVADGRIEKLFLSKPGGRTIYQFDPEGRVAYYYAHLDAYAPQLSEGQAVRRGQVIGYVGSTGNADPQAPHLHFAIFLLGPQKRWWEGTPVNPYPLLGGG
jgi:murein DD-endopeptidase MepM/ murein hydrolase activator NlpD